MTAAECLSSKSLRRWSLRALLGLWILALVSVRAGAAQIMEGELRVAVRDPDGAIGSSTNRIGEPKPTLSNRRSSRLYWPGPAAATTAGCLPSRGDEHRIRGVCRHGRDPVRGTPAERNYAQARARSNGDHGASEGSIDGSFSASASDAGWS